MPTGISGVAATSRGTESPERDNVALAEVNGEPLLFGGFDFAAHRYRAALPTCAPRTTLLSPFVAHRWARTIPTFIRTAQTPASTRTPDDPTTTWVLFESMDVYNAAFEWTETTNTGCRGPQSESVYLASPDRALPDSTGNRTRHTAAAPRSSRQSPAHHRRVSTRSDRCAYLRDRTGANPQGRRRRQKRASLHGSCSNHVSSCYWSGWCSQPQRLRRKHRPVHRVGRLVAWQSA